MLTNRYGTSGYVSNSNSSCNNRSNKSDYRRFCSIKLENYSSIVKPHTLIKGNFHIQEDKIPTSLRAYGIRIQLDGTVNLKLPMPKDASTSVKKVEGIFEGCSVPGNADYVRPPEGSRVLIYLKPGLNVYPFALKFPEEPLPAPFSTTYGNLGYEVVAYHQIWTDYYYELAQHHLTFNGYHNLASASVPPTIAKPISVKFEFELSFRKSIFSSKKSFTEVELWVEKRGFVTGQKLAFQLTVSNSNGFLVQEATVRLIRRATFRHNQKGLRKRIDEVVDVFVDQDGKNEARIGYNGLFTIPKSCGPTYTRKSIYSVNYFVQFDLTIAEFKKHGPVTGEVEVIIGTNSEPLIDNNPETTTSSADNRRRNTLDLDNQRGQVVGSPGQGRSTSIPSKLSDNSVMTRTVSVPPTYSQLPPSRAFSLMTMKPANPSYEDIKD